MTKQLKTTSRNGIDDMAAPKDRMLRDGEVPELYRRTRGGRDSWVVYVPRETGRPRKVTLGACASIPPARARDLARDMLSTPATNPQLSPGITLSDFTDIFLQDCRGRWKPSTLHAHKHCLRVQLRPTFGHRQVREISRSHVIAWLGQVGASTGARNRALSVLSSLMDHAEIRGLRGPGSNPCKGLRRHHSAFRATYLDAAGYAALGRAFEGLKPTHFVAVELLRFLALTGCRKSEALRLKWHMIDGRRAALPDAKSGPRSIWLGRPALRLLAGLPRVGEHVFEVAGKPMTEGALDRLWWRVREEAGQPHLRLHDLRHSFASVAVSEGFDLLVVGGLLGHSDKGSTAGYAHLDSRAVAASTKRVGKHFAKVMAKKPKRVPSKLDPFFIEFTRSKEGLTAFCAARDLDPKTFREGLARWRSETSGART